MKQSVDLTLSKANKPTCTCVGECLRRSNNDGLPGVDAKRVYVLHVANLKTIGNLINISDKLHVQH